MLLEAAGAAQGCHAGSRHGGVLDAADGWDICIVLQQTVNCFGASFVWPSEDDDSAVNAGPGDGRVLHE